MIGPILVFIWLGVAVAAIYNFDQYWAHAFMFVSVLPTLIVMLMGQRYRIDDD